MPTYAYPGVYIEEIPSGVNPIEGVGTSTAAFIGYTWKGPITEPVRITKWDDYEDQFGGIHKAETNDPVDYMGYAVNAYFMNGGTSAYIARVAKAVKAEGKLFRPVTQPGTPDDVLYSFVAVTEGAWAHDYRIVVKAKTSGTMYTVTVQHKTVVQGVDTWQNVPNQIFDNVSFNPSPSESHIVKAVSLSTLVGVVEVNAQNLMFGESRSGDIPGTTNFSSLNGKKLTLEVNGISVTISFDANAFPGPPLPTSAADVAAKIQNLVTIALNAGTAPVPAFKADAVTGTGNAHLVLQSRTPGVSSSVVVKPTSPSGDDAATLLKLGATAAGATERTGEQVLHDQIASQPDSSSVVPLTGGSNEPVSTTNDYKAALARFVKITDVNTIVLPGKGYPSDAGTLALAVAHCDAMRNRMTIVDVDPATALLEEGDVGDLELPSSTYAVMYYPWVDVANPYYHPETAPDQPRTVRIPPSSFAAGMWGKTDARRGVWKAPAGNETALLGVAGLEFIVDDGDQDVLNPLGVNCLRRMPGVGPAIWGARTLATQAIPEWRYVPVRRTAIYIERSIYSGISWAVFEPNNHILWASLRANIGAFMDGLFRAGAFQGEKASDAYYVLCDLDVTFSQAEVDKGQVHARVGFAPLKPAEFVVIKIQQTVGLQ